MTRFIWVRDIDKREHYINVHHIIRVTKVPAYAPTKSDPYAYMVLEEGAMTRDIRLFTDAYDTADDVIAKIQAAMA